MVEQQTTLDAIPTTDVDLPLGGYQVIAMHAARRLMHAMDLGCRRKDGETLIVHGARRSTTLWMPADADEEHKIGRLVVDEGYYNDCLVWYGQGPEIAYSNPSWDELVDAKAFLGMLARHIASFPDSPPLEIENSPYIGSGRTTRHYKAQYVAYLADLTLGHVRFVPVPT